MKRRLLEASYEICLARALHFTRAYRQTEGMAPCLRNALALKRTLERQDISIEPDELLAGSKTEKFLAGPLSVERGDFLRSMQLELDVLHEKQRPFSMSEGDKKLFYEEILPYWDGRSLRDHKARQWEAQDLIDTAPGPLATARRCVQAVRFAGYLDLGGARKLMGANLRARPGLRRLRTLYSLRFELARNNPTPAVFCFDVQGHLSLGVDKVVGRGMGAIIDQARERQRRLDRRDPRYAAKKDFLEAVVVSLEAAVAYAGRFAALAREMAARTGDPGERGRLGRIAANCERVPRKPPETFHQALQAAWFTLLVGEIQYGTHDVFAVGRIDQYLYPTFERDLRAGRLTRAEAVALLQEFFLKQSANIEPIPEIGMETNSVLGNNQHTATIGGLTPGGDDATCELTFAALDAFEAMGGSLNQLSIRISDKSPPDLLRRAVSVLRKTNGIALYNDRAVLAGLRADGMRVEDARDFCIVGCIETSGQSDTHGCPGGHELTLPAVLMLTLTRGRLPPPAPGQQAGFDSGDPETFPTFDLLLQAFRRQLVHQIDVLVAATAAKDRAFRDVLPAPYVSALMDDCIEKARDITDGGARYDFTSVAVRGLATLVDSFLAVRTVVYDQRELDLVDFVRTIEKNFAGQEALRQRIIHCAPKYGRGEPAADRLAGRVVEWISEAVSAKRNERGGRYRVCYYSYGNHVIDGIMLGATPDGRRRGEPISNGISPADLAEPTAGPAGPLRSAAAIPPEQASSGVSLNMRFHPRTLATEEGVETFASMVRTYFDLGGMHIQPNVVSEETLRDAQRRPERYRDLVVKVSGYSAYFTDLGSSIQEDIIARYEFGDRV